jgi:hypothetical protein
VCPAEPYLSNIEIPTYLADGTRCTRGHYPLQRVMRLHDLGKVTLEYKGRRIIAAHYRKDTGESSVAAKVPTGTKYSFPERLPDTTIRVWKHKELPRPETGCDLFVRRIFRQVAIDCLTDYKEAPQRVTLVGKKAA